MAIAGKRILAIGIAITALACLFPLNVFVIIAAEQTCYLRSPDFELSWRHSVEHQLWREHYRRDGDSILLDQTLLQTFGAGTPSQGEVIPAPNGYVAYRQQLHFNEINWVVSANMQGSLTAKEQVIPLYQFVPDYSVIRIIPSRTTLLFFLLGRSCHDRPT